VLFLLLQHHANRPLPDFRGISLLCFHNSILSKVGVSGKAGAVHELSSVFLCGEEGVVYLSNEALLSCQGY
jgi:hypothetical protein